MFGKFRNSMFAYFVAFCIVLLLIVAILNIKAQRDSREMLEESVRSQLISICVAAREAIDVEDFAGFNSEADIRNNRRYDKTLEELRRLAASVGAKYIYALRNIDGRNVFVYDTDPEIDTAFTEYAIAPVHAEAFRGRERAAIMNVRDEFGNFSTGAVPLWKDGKVVGVVSADLEDDLIAKNRSVGCRNILLLLGAVAVTMIVMTLIMRALLRRINEMRERLTRLAHYDAVTGLPNRQYLLEHLEEMGKKGDKAPFALMFIDLDNFKRVNDVAGHDAGDALLKRIGAYLKKPYGARRNSTVYRPGAGKLNVAARIGGDEFVIITPNVDNPRAAADIARTLLENFHEDAIDEHIKKFNVGMSIGVSLYPSQSEDYNVLIKYADIAMYHAKNAGKNCYRVYDDELPDKSGK